MSVLADLVRRYAPRTRRAGRTVWITDGDPVLVAAFAALGWDDGRPVDADEPADTVAAPAADPAPVAPEDDVRPEDDGA